jgi:hypothetical protein
MNEEGVSGLIQRVSSLSYGYEGRLELHLIGAFADLKGIAAALLHSALSELIPGREGSCRLHRMLPTV